ncbi:MAG: transposase [Firmicutes bacterium]|nr:transposase [Bacillota bacterium]
MARVSREAVFSASDYFHVLVQGIDREYIFSSEADKFSYLGYLNEKKTKHNISILAYCVMGNHAHLLLYATQKENISKFIKDVNVTYALSYNRKRGRVGYVFRDRFRAEAIDSDRYLLTCIAYIHQNPVKAGMVMREDDYSFSSAKTYKSQARDFIVDFAPLEAIYGSIPELPTTGTEEMVRTISSVPVVRGRKGFLDDDGEGKVSAEIAITNAMFKFGIEGASQLKNDDTLLALVNEITQNARISIRELCAILEVSRDRVNRLLRESHRG